MRAVVIHDDMHVARRRQLRVEALEEFQELLVPVSPMTLPDDFAGRHVQRGKQRRRPVTM